MKHQITTSLMIILSLIFMSGVSGNSPGGPLQPENCRERCGKCTIPSDCADHCPFGHVYTCTLGQCYCGIVEQKKEAATLKYCNSPCECHEKCKIGLPICFHHVCGCVDHALYQLPNCPQI